MKTYNLEKIIDSKEISYIEETIEELENNTSKLKEIVKNVKKKNDKEISKFYNFSEIIKYKKIKIPKIQRNYVQGYYNEIREKIIYDIFETLKRNEKIDLDIIYGIFEDEFFIPIDGQQRLTTLFLLYWYIYEIVERDEESLKSINLEIVYETQKYTQEFFEMLKDKSLELKEANDNNKDNKKFSDIIKESIYYYKSKWDNDVTVQSALNMLDEIVGKYMETKIENIKERLNNIVFYCYNIKKSDKIDPEELYIKMNSRGKQLNDFEKYKSYLEKIANEMYVKSSFDKYEEFCKNMNNKWPNIIYSFEKSNFEKIEEYLYKVIRIFIINFFTEKYCIENNNIEKQKKIVETINKQKKYEIDAKDELLIKNVDNNFWNKLSNVLNNIDELYKNDEESKKIIDINERWKNLIANDQRPDLQYLLEYYAIMKYFEILGEKKKGNLLNWIRIIRNLIEIKGHIQITNEEKGKPSYFKIFKDINVLAQQLKKYPDIVEFFYNTKFESVDLEKNETTEIWFELEKTKAEKSKEEKWEREIIQADKIKYLTGRIGFLFQISNENFENFKKYRNIVEQIFNDEEIKEESLIQRAMLTNIDYDYWCENDGCYTFLNFEDSDNTNVWKRELNENEKIRKKFLNFIDKELLNCNNSVKDRLKDIINNFQKTNSWRIFFIKENLFEKSEKARIYFPNAYEDYTSIDEKSVNNIDIDIIKKRASNSKHWDYINWYLYKILEKEKNENIELQYRGKTGNRKNLDINNYLTIFVKDNNKVTEKYSFLRIKENEYGEYTIILNDNIIEYSIYNKNHNKISIDELSKINDIILKANLKFEIKK